MFSGRLKNYILYVVTTFSLVFGGFFDYSTIYVSGTMGTPYVKGNIELEDDYKYTIGLRKIALFDYQSRKRFYKGTEQQLSDKAIVGAVNGWEYLFSFSDIRNRGHEYSDFEVWLKWSNDSFVTKMKYIEKQSRDLQIFDYDLRYRMSFKKANISLGAAVRGHPVYGHPAIEDYEDPWWYLAYEYGYTDYLVPLHDLNGNDEIDNYYIWIETDPITEEGYWEMFYEEASYYWEDSDSVAVAYSDSEFYEYYMPDIIRQYNEDNKVKEWQAELNLALGFDFPEPLVTKIGSQIFLRRNGGSIHHHVRHELKIDPAMWCYTPEDYWNLANEFESITTDRLHLAICSLAMNTKTTILPVNYHKNKAMFTEWLEPIGCSWKDHVLSNEISGSLEGREFTR